MNCDELFFNFLGISGSPIELSANYMRLLSRPKWTVYQYHVDFKPPIESRRLCYALLFNHEEVLGKTKTFDGRSILFLQHPLHNTVNGCTQRSSSCIINVDYLSVFSMSSFLYWKVI